MQPQLIRSLNFLCPLIAVGIVGILFAPRDRPTHSALSPDQSRPVSANSPGQRIEPQAIAYMSDATREAARDAAQAAAQAAYDKLVANRGGKFGGKLLRARASAYELAQIRTAALPYLLQGIEHPCVEIRHACFWQLQEEFSDEPAFVNEMIKLLDDKNENHFLRSWAAQNLGERQPERAADLLIRILESKDENAELRGSAAALLGKYTPQRVADLLISILANNDEDAGLRSSVAFLLGTYKIDRAVDVLRQTCRDEEKLRLTAAKSLAELGVKESAPILYQALGSDRWHERRQANLGFLGLTGRDTAHDDYHWKEDASILSGMEVLTRRSPIERNRHKAARFQAIIEYLQWLKAERPEIYAEIDPAATNQRQPRQTAQIRAD